MFIRSQMPLVSTTLMLPMVIGIHDLRLAHSLLRIVLNMFSDDLKGAYRVKTSPSKVSYIRRVKQVYLVILA